MHMIDTNYLDRIAQFETLFDKHALDKGKEPMVEKSSHMFKGCDFQNAVDIWKREAENLIFMAMWRQEQKRADAPSQLPDESHPLAKQLKNYSRRLRPQIMIRFCEKRCYEQIRLSDLLRASS